MGIQDWQAKEQGGGSGLKIKVLWLVYQKFHCHKTGLQDYMKRIGFSQLEQWCDHILSRKSREQKALKKKLIKIIEQQVTIL